MAITRVQGNAKGSTTGTSIAVTMVSDPTNGNLLVAVICSQSIPHYQVSSITQTGVTWTSQIAYQEATYNYFTVEVWVGVIGAGANASITVNLSGDVSDGAVANICEYSGLATVGFLDKTATAVEAGDSAIPKTGTTAATTQADELWIGCIDQYAGNAFSNPINGFTLLDGAVSGTVVLGYLEKIVSSTGTANSAVTGTDGNGWAGCIATFKASVAGGQQLFTLLNEMGY